MPNEVLVAEDLKVMIEGRLVLGDVSLKLRAGEVILITGPTGSGKSTMLKTFSGLIPKLYPSFKVQGYVSVLGLRPEEAAGKGLLTYVPQDVSAYFIGSRVDDELAFRGLKCLNDVLPDNVKCNSLIHQLSDGQLYGLLTASAIASGVKLIMLDEPTTHIDPWTLPKVLRMIKSHCVSSGASAIIVEHRVKVVSEFTDKVLTLVNGSLIVEEPYGEVADPELSHAPLTGEAVTLDDVYFTYDGLRYVLNGVSASFRRGEVVVVLGRNGAGKTTLLKVLSGSLSPSKGKVIVNGNRFIIPQSPIHWFCTYSVSDELKLYAKAWGFKGDLSSVIQQFELRNLLDRVPHTLSAGESRRLSLALSMISGADVVLMDEPSTGLDDVSIKSLIKYIDSVASEGRSVIIATHDLRLARYADRVFTLEGGVLKVAHRPLNYVSG